ncbi:hypothetical protein IRJ41_006030 [Triplophysa rosa]|uniref:Ig-like domain-containing protein n=1 Tax=Triplophysa rosa TaxID=992332 RepID=A0A9W7TS41_TRIRA|nr:hypothetical protein IRJ41_006030 [Triplophysa rosa]
MKMIRDYLIVAVTIIWFTGSVFSNDVSQSPSDVFKAKGDDAEIECQHSISSYNVILWYKQTLNNGLKLLGIIQYKNNQAESEFLNKIHLKGDGASNGLLVIKDLSAACLGKRVVQTPGDLLKNQTETAVIICTHNIPSYDRILWRRFGSVLEYGKSYGAEVLLSSNICVMVSDQTFSACSDFFSSHYFGLQVVLPVAVFNRTPQI